MKIRGKTGKVFIGLLFWIIAVWSFASVSFAAPPTARNLKWGGDHGLTAQWDLKNYYDNTVYVQLKRKCVYLTKITIPSKVEYIGKEAFYGCKKIKSIKISTSKLTADNVGTKAFSGTYFKATVKVPSKKVKVYKKLLVQKGMHKKAIIRK